jgi:hypothetical protein
VNGMSHVSCYPRGNFLPSSTSDIFVLENGGNHDALCILGGDLHALYMQVGQFACALHASRSICILISSCAVYGGPLLYTCSRTYFGDIFVFLIDVRSLFAASMASASAWFV